MGESNKSVRRDLGSGDIQDENNVLGAVIRMLSWMGQDCLAQVPKESLSRDTRLEHVRTRSRYCHGAEGIGSGYAVTLMDIEDGNRGEYERCARFGTCFCGWWWWWW
jgi:hypothetical protein